MGKQWLWEYQISDFFLFGKHKNYSFESYMGFYENNSNSSSFFPGSLRLLEVDVQLVLPLKLHIRFWITSSDVLHSFSIPSFGVKIDACPGRLNQINIFIKRKGVYYGSCQEICGVNHAFMPIVVWVFEEFEDFINWTQKMILN